MDREKLLDDILACSGVRPEEVEPLKDVIRNSSIYKSKSDNLFRYGTMTQLMFDMFGPYLDMFMVLADPASSEVVSFTHAASADGMPEGWEKSEKVIDHLIPDLCVAGAMSKRFVEDNHDGQEAGNEILTIIMNVAARYCVKGQEYKDAFDKCIEYWQDKKNQHKTDANENHSPEGSEEDIKQDNT